MSDEELIAALEKSNGVHWILTILARVLRDHWAGTDSAELANQLAKNLEECRDRV